MIVVKVTGGIGNQLFQYSFGKCIAAQYGTRLKFDVQTNYNFSGFTSRPFLLEDLQLDILIAKNEEIQNFRYFKSGLLSRLERKLICFFPFLNKHYIVQNLYQPCDSGTRYGDNCYYDGYWQSEKYFKAIENELKQDLQTKLQSRLDKSNISHLNEIENQASISLHIRRGDYISIESNKGMFSTCSLEYYEKAMNYFKNEISSPVFFIFSDDINWARSNFKGEQFRFVDNNSQSPEIDLFLMSKCKHNIIANSSFSWWGAWLNTNINKIVIAPKKWFKNKMSDKDLIPDNWLRIDN